MAQAIPLDNMTYSSDAWFNLDSELTFVGKNVLYAMDAITSTETILNIYDGREKQYEFKFSGTLSIDESYFGKMGIYLSTYLTFKSDKPCLIRPLISQKFDPEIKIEVGVVSEKKLNII